MEIGNAFEHVIENGWFNGRLDGKNNGKKTAIGMGFPSNQLHPLEVQTTVSPPGRSVKNHSIRRESHVQEQSCVHLSSSVISQFNWIFPVLVESRLVFVEVFHPNNAMRTQSNRRMLVKC